MLANDRLTKLKSRVAVEAKLFNAKVSEAYGHRQDPTGKTLLSALVIDENDSTLDRVEKMMIFFLVCERLPLTATGLITEGSGIGRSIDVTTAQVRIKSPKKYADKKAIGYYYVRVPHAVETAWETLRGYRQTYGKITALYVFADKRQIKINVKDEKEGHRCINHLLKVVDPKRLIGTSEKHTHFSHPPPDKKPPRIDGLTAEANQITLLLPDRTELSHLI
jgi:hypothetical protein